MITTVRKAKAFTLLAAEYRAEPGCAHASGPAAQRGCALHRLCVGNQLVGGADDVYRVVADGSCGLYWKAAGPISDWTFDPASPRTGSSSRTASLCYDRNLT
ncbi:hypothetical protein [Nocardia sp. NPDC049526]|uniref:hypothetical protein n=1 Tax=Nocardia sp. NPDC049526 TaxID=3364316 RepID=UPI00379194B6